MISGVVETSPVNYLCSAGINAFVQCRKSPCVHSPAMLGRIARHVAVLIKRWQQPNQLRQCFDNLEAGRKQKASADRSNGRRMLSLQTQGVLQLGFEDHLASSHTNGDRAPLGLSPHLSKTCRNFRGPSTCGHGTECPHTPHFGTTSQGRCNQ